MRKRMRFVGPIIHLVEGHYLNWIKQVQLRQPAVLTALYSLVRTAAALVCARHKARGRGAVRCAVARTLSMQTSVKFEICTHNKSVTKPVKMSLYFIA